MAGAVKAISRVVRIALEQLCPSRQMSVPLTCLMMREMFLRTVLYCEENNITLTQLMSIIIVVQYCSQANTQAYQHIASQHHHDFLLTD